MSSYSSHVSSPVTAVLGPTNTGKTHLAIERMLGYETGMIGFPLRLLAREVYDRIVKLKGAGQVALITGEEKILPPDPAYYICTVEAMPISKSVDFMAIDEKTLLEERKVLEEDFNTTKDRIAQVEKDLNNMKNNIIKKL